MTTFLPTQIYLIYLSHIFLHHRKFGDQKKVSTKFNITNDVVNKWMLLSASSRLDKIVPRHTRVVTALIFHVYLPFYRRQHCRRWPFRCLSFPPLCARLASVFQKYSFRDGNHSHRFIQYSGCRKRLMRGCVTRIHTRLNRLKIHAPSHTFTHNGYSVLFGFRAASPILWGIHALSRRLKSVQFYFLSVSLMILHLLTIQSNEYKQWIKNCVARVSTQIGTITRKNPANSTYSSTKTATSSFFSGFDWQFSNCREIESQFFVESKASRQ